MGAVAGKGRDNRGYPVEDTVIKKQSRGESMRVPGSGGVTVPQGGVDDRSAQHHANAMQAVVGGGSPEEHEYAPKENRRRQKRR